MKSTPTPPPYATAAENDATMKGEQAARGINKFMKEFLLEKEYQNRLREARGVCLKYDEDAEAFSAALKEFKVGSEALVSYNFGEAIVRFHAAAKIIECRWNGRVYEADKDNDEEV